MLRGNAREGGLHQVGQLDEPFRVGQAARGLLRRLGRRAIFPGRRTHQPMISALYS
jgi:hypothetical protein